LQKRTEPVWLAVGERPDVAKISAVFAIPAADFLLPPEVAASLFESAVSREGALPTAHLLSAGAR
jgi:hypothetical protein